MTKKEQKILNIRLRMAVRTGELPFSFTDTEERNYRRIVYELGRETGRKYTVRRVGSSWTVDYKSSQEAE